jgi:hypothetical protein
MFCVNTDSIKSIPAEYQAPLTNFAKALEAGSVDTAHAEACAKAMGVIRNYKLTTESLEGCTAEYEDDFLAHVHDNLDLLISKTWVSKTDEMRKIKLQDRIPSLVSLIEGKDYPLALREFCHIMEEMAYLFFGAQSKKPDFVEYTLRIDQQFGIFWCFIGLLDVRLENEEPLKGDLRSVLLAAFCYLRNL